MIDLEFVGDYRNPQQLTARQRELGFDGTSAGDFSFDDFLDIINPLQHIPGVSTLYRAITGDEISPHARIFGGTLFGGPAGFASAAANTLFDEVTGSDIGETLIALFTGEEAGAEPQFAGTDAEAMPAEAPLETAAGAAAVDLPAEPGPGVLTGEAALAALFNDLRGGRQAMPIPQDETPPQGMPLPERQAPAEMRSYPLPPRTGPATPTPPAKAPEASQASESEAPAAHPLIFAQEAGEADIARHMMQALDRYRAMTQARRQDEETKPSAAPEAHEVRWQSDPLSPGNDG